MIRLQAHRGVCTEYPENTMAAFRGAVEQGYEIIELDPAVTADGVFVVMHDRTINRTARRPEGNRIEEPVKISEITYEEASSYDYGMWFAPEFQGEKLPLLNEVLAFAKEADVLVKIDNKFRSFPEECMDSFFKLLRESGARIAMTCNSLELSEKVVAALPEAELHYDGEVTEEALKVLHTLTDKLTVWLPYQCKLTSWVRIPFVSAELCELVKKYAQLGIWILDSYEDFEAVSRMYQPDIVETPGHIKPMK